MSERGLPPYPYGGDWVTWARALVEFLSNEARSEEFVAPRIVSLLHQIPPVDQYRALTDGLLMFDPALGIPVYSKNGAWEQFTAQGNLNYRVTDDAGAGDVVDDINNTDFTGQEGAVGACAETPANVVVHFYHKGIQYLYTGPRPALYGAGCADTMIDDYLIPVGVGNFLALTDTPDSYAGEANKWPRVSPTEGDLVFDVIEEADITNLDRVRWRGSWVQQQYEKNDMVLADANWLMIANKQTSEVAPPRPVGDPQWDMPDFPAWATNQFTGVVRSGREWEITEPIDIRGFDIWVPTLNNDTNYVIFVYSYPTGDPSQLKAIQIPEPILSEDVWTTVSLDRSTLTAGTTLGIYIDALNAGSDTLVTGGWSRAVNNNTTTADPGTGAWGTNNAETSLRINYTDLDTTDRTNEIQGIVPGTTFEAVQTNDTSKSVTWTINGNGVDHTTHMSFDNLSTSDYGPNGPPDIGATCTLNITIPVPSATDYVQIVGGNPTHTWGTSRGLLSLDGVAQPVNADAFGVRVLVDTYVVPQDWDIASALGSSGGGGGGGGGASTFTQLSDTPASYAGHAGKAVIVNQNEDALEFAVAQNSIQIVDEGSFFQIVGGKLICWGTAVTDASGLAAFTYPRAFASAPRVTGTAVGNTNWNIALAANSATGSTLAAIGGHTNAPAGAGLQVHYHAVGDIPAGEEMPTEITVIGTDGSQYLNKVTTSPQNVAGVVSFDDSINVGSTAEVNHADFPHLRIIHPGSTSGIDGWSMFVHPTVSNTVDGLRFEYWTGGGTTYGSTGLRVGTRGITTNQDVRIATPITTAGSANVHMDANGYMRKFTSLAEYKENVAPVVSAIAGLNPVTFDSKHEADEGGRFAGFIAEEVWAAIPEAKQPDGYDQNAIIAHLVKEVQELRKRLDEMVDFLNIEIGGS